MNETFRSPKTLGYLAMAGLAAGAVLNTVAAIVWFSRLMGATPTFQGTQGGIWLAVTGALALAFPVAIFTIVFFLIWLNRVNKNLHPLGADNVEFSSGWAVGWWFIPFANLVKPFQVVREVWFDSDPEATDEPVFLSASLKTAPTFMGLWWAFWIGGNLVSNISLRVFDANRVETLEAAAFSGIVGAILTVIAGVLAIQVVSSINARQELKAQRVSERLNSLPPPPSEYAGQMMSGFGSDDPSPEPQSQT